MTHEVFTIVAPVHPGPDVAERLRKLLERINQEPAGNPLLPFKKLPMVHFASFVVFSNPVQEERQHPRPVNEEQRPPVSLPKQLVFESCIDGPFDEYLEALVQCGLPALHDIFSCCTDYTSKEPSAVGLKAYFRRKRQKPHLLHIGNPGLRVDHIHAGQRLRAALDSELDEVVRHGGSTDRPLDLMRALRARLNVPPSRRNHWFLAEPAPSPAGAPRFAWFGDQQSLLRSQLWHWGKLILFLLAGVGLSGLATYWLWHLGGLRAVLAAVAVVGSPGTELEFAL